MVHVSVDAVDLLDRSEAQGATYQLYAYFSPESYVECEMSNTCGTLVAEGEVGGYTDVATDSGDTSGINYLALIMLEGHYTGYFMKQVSLLGGRGYSNMVKIMGTDQNRVVLRWDHDADLDLWIDATFGSGSQAPYQFVNYNDKSASFDFQSIHHEYDSQNGLDNGPGTDTGPETARFEALTDGRFEIWVNLFSFPDENIYNFKNHNLSFSRELVRTAPASVDVFCDFCLDEDGVTRVGRVTTVTQSEDDLPSSGDVKWWKVGEFKAVEFGFINVEWSTCKTGCYRASTRMFAGGQPLTVIAKYLLDGSELPDKRVRIFVAAPETKIGCDPDVLEGDATCGTPVAEGTGAGSVNVPPDKTYLVVVTLEGYYNSYLTVYVPDGGAEISANCVGLLDTNQDRIVLRWGHSGDLDLYVKANWGSGEEAVIYYDEMSSNDGDSSVILDLDNLNGFDGPETTRFETALEGTFEVWVNVYELPGDDPEYADPEIENGKFSTHMLAKGLATIDVFCYSCVVAVDGGEDVNKVGLATSITQSVGDIETDEEVGWWKVGQFVAPAGDARLKWETCVSDCYSADDPFDLRRRAASWLSRMTSDLSSSPDARTKLQKHVLKHDGAHTLPRQARLQPVPQTLRNRSLDLSSPRHHQKKHRVIAANYSRHSLDKYPYRSAQMRAIPVLRKQKRVAKSRVFRTPDPRFAATGNFSWTHQNSGKASVGYLSKNKFSKHTPQASTEIAVPRQNSRSQTQVRMTKIPSSRNKQKGGRKLLQVENLNNWAEAETLLQMSLDRSDYFAINVISLALSQEIDAKKANGMVTSTDASVQKLYVLAKLNEALNRALKNEGYICEILSVSQMISVDSKLLNLESVKKLSQIMNTVLTTANIPSFQTECAKSALSINSKALDALAYAQTCLQESGPSQSSDDDPLREYVNNLESSMKRLASKQLASLLEGQTTETWLQNSTSQITKRKFKDILDVPMSLKAAAGGQSGFTASYKLPATIVKDIEQLRPLDGFSVHFDTFHNAPRIDGIQPISPLVALSLSHEGSEIPVFGLTKNVEIVLPVINQAICETTPYQSFECMYWAGDTYKSDGCYVKKGKVGDVSVTCSCSHLTSIVVVPGVVPPITTPPPTTSGPPVVITTSASITSTSPSATSARAALASTTPAPSAPPPPMQVQSTPAVASGPIIFPATDIHVGYVEVLVGTKENSFLNITTDGVMPTCVGGVNGVDKKFVVTESMTMMAISCEDGETSARTSRKFLIEPGPVVELRMTLVGSVSAADLRDDAKNEKKFLIDLSEFLGVAVERMALLSVQDARRRLLSIDLTVGVVTNSDAAAEKMSADFAAADFGAFISALGWENIEVSGVTTVIRGPPSQVSTPAPTATEKKPSNVPIIVAAGVGAVVFVCILASLVYFFLSHTAAKKKLSEKLGTTEAGGAENIEEATNVLELELEPEPDSEDLVDFNRDIQLANCGPEVLRLVKERAKKMIAAPHPMEASAGAVHPDHFRVAMGLDEIDARICGTPRPSSTPISADIGVDFSSFSLMLPWQEQAIKGSSGGSLKSGHAADDDASLSSQRFQKSLQTVNLWKAQQKVKVENGPKRSATPTPPATNTSQNTDALARKNTNVDSGPARMQMLETPVKCVDLEAILQENQEETQEDLFGGVSKHLLSAFGAGPK